MPSLSWTAVLTQGLILPFLAGSQNCGATVPVARSQSSPGLCPTPQQPEPSQMEGMLRDWPQPSFSFEQDVGAELARPTDRSAFSQELQFLCSLPVSWSLFSKPKARRWRLVSMGLHSAHNSVCFNCPFTRCPGFNCDRVNFLPSSCCVLGLVW